MRSIFTVLFCFGFVAVAQGEEYRWLPATPPISVPAVSLGAPLPLAPAAGLPAQGETITHASYSRSVLGAPQAIIRCQSPDVSGPSLVPPAGSTFPPPPPPPPPGNEPYNCGVVAGPPGTEKHGFFHRIHDWFGRPHDSTATRTAFQSDHGFDEAGLISPVSNPFLFEDPRSLTEIRPIFMWQQTPSSTPVFSGGDVEYAGIQARLALTERLSVVMSKLGWVWAEEHEPFPGVENGSGFAEVWIGPKYTFYRCEQTGTVAAAGLNFQIPIGASKVAQDTGDLTLEPYISFAQNFGRSSFGSFNFMNTTGYAVDIGDHRSDYIFSSFHLDYDVARLHKIYPLIEFNYFHYTDSGDVRPLNFEGRDLFNFGSTAVQGHDELTMAAGARYKFSECVQTGITGEFPLNSPHGLMDFRLTADMIFRY